MKKTAQEALRPIKVKPYKIDYNKRVKIPAVWFLLNDDAEEAYLYLTTDGDLLVSRTRYVDSKAKV